MASYVYLASAVVMGLVAITVFVATARGREWYDYSPQIGRPEPGFLRGLTGDVRAWVLGFLVLVVAITAAVLAAVDGGNLLFIFGVLGLLIVSFLTFGVYAAGRSRGHPHSHAVGEALITLGTVILIGIAINLIVSFGNVLG